MGYDLRKWLIKCLIWCVATYGVETWTLSKDAIRRLESFEMWCWRKIDRKMNNWVLKEAGEEKPCSVHEKKKTSMVRPRSKTRWPPEGSHRRET